MKDLLEAAHQEAIAVLSNEIKGKCIMEPAIRTPDGRIVYDVEGLQTPVRKDVARQEGDSWVTANVDARGICPSSPMRTLWKHEMSVIIESVTWDYVTFSLTPAAHGSDATSIRDWFLRWFDSEEAHIKTSEGLFGVVHFISDPIFSEGRFDLIVDFGSAPTQAFLELLDCFVQLGFTECQVR